jgi:hypothetical protein
MLFKIAWLHYFKQHNLVELVCKIFLLTVLFKKKLGLECVKLNKLEKSAENILILEHLVIIWK